MAVLSDYTLGTVSVAANATVVTGTGTSWLLKDFQEGDTIMIDNLVAVLSGPPTTNTSLPITRPWTGGAKTNVAYRLRYQPDGSRYTNRTQQLIDLLGDGLIASVAAAGSAVDKIAYYTGVGVTALTDFKAKGRDIASADTMLSLLGKLGPVFGGPTPTPSAAGVGLSDGNFDDIVIPGLYTTAGSWTNGPYGAGGVTSTGLLEVYSRGNNYFLQIFRRSNNLMFKRFTNSGGGIGGWSAWAAFEHETVGTVLNVSGFPGGSIIERGSNANGEYVKFADGTMIVTADIASVNTNVASGSLFNSGLVSAPFPATFIAIPVGFGASLSTISMWLSPRATSTTGWGFTTWSTGSRTNDTIKIGAIGRWF